MPIRVECACGAALKVPETMAGRRVRCPKCAQPVAVPAGDVAAPDPPAPAAGPTRPCPYCAEPIQVAALVCRYCKSRLGPGGPGPGPRPAANRDLPMEAHVQAIAIWYRIGGVLTGLAGLLFLVTGAMGGSSAGTEIMLLGLMVAGMGVLIYRLGHHLGKLSNAARIAGGVLAVVGLGIQALQLLMIVAGSAPRGQSPGVAFALGLLQMGYSGALAWALFNARSSAICSEPYRQVVRQSPGERPPTYASPFFWGPFALVGVASVFGFIGGLSRMR